MRSLGTLHQSAPSTQYPQGPSPDDVRSSVSAAVMVDSRVATSMALPGQDTSGQPSSAAAAAAAAAGAPLAAGPGGSGAFGTSPSGIDLATDSTGLPASGAVAAAAEGHPVAVEAAAAAVVAAAGTGSAPARPPGGGPGVADAASRTVVLQRDAFLVFRALCKLSIRTNESATSNDPTAIR